MGRDSSELMWDDVNRVKFYSLLTLASAAIRTCLYPAALVKTRMQVGESPPPATSSHSHQSIASTSGSMHPKLATANAVPPVQFTPASSAASTHRPRYRGTAHAFTTILRTEGKLALYRGFRINLLGLSCDPIVTGTLEYTRTKLTDYWMKGHMVETSTTMMAGMPGPMHHENFIFRYIMSPGTCITLVSAGSAACVGQIIQVPVDIITQKKQMQTHALVSPTTGELLKTEGTGSFHIAREIVAAEGVRGLYKGFGITLCSAMPFTALLWAVYWPSQKFFHRCLTAGSSHSHLIMMEETMAQPQQPQPTPPKEKDWDWRDAVPAPLAAFVASASASLATQPIDVIKTRLQVHGGAGSTIASTVRALVHERGWIGLLSGWYPRILAVSPGATVMMSSYEALKRLSAL